MPVSIRPTASAASVAMPRAVPPGAPGAPPAAPPPGAAALGGAPPGSPAAPRSAAVVPLLAPTTVMRSAPCQCGVPRPAGAGTTTGCERDQSGTGDAPE